MSLDQMRDPDVKFYSLDLRYVLKNTPNTVRSLNSKTQTRHSLKLAVEA